MNREEALAEIERLKRLVVRLDAEMSPSERAKRNGQPCARCGMKSGAHDWPNRHQRACTEWLTSSELADEVERSDEDWFFDGDGRP